MSKLFPDSDSKQNFFNDLKMLGYVAAIFGSIVLLGSSVKIPGLAIVVGTLGMAALTWFGSKGNPKKTRILLTAVWAGLVLAFTVAGVLS